MLNDDNPNLEYTHTIYLLLLQLKEGEAKKQNKSTQKEICMIFFLKV
jgi:hypothetical protein